MNNGIRTSNQAKTRKRNMTLMIVLISILTVAAIVCASIILALSGKEISAKIFLNDGTENYYTITGRHNSEKSLLDQNFLNLNLSAEYAQNYHLIGFSYDLEGISPDFDKNETIILKKEKILYAIWKGNPCEITLSGVDSMLVNSGSFEATILNLTYNSTYKIDISLFADIYEANTGACVHGLYVSKNGEAPILYTDGQEIVIKNNMEFVLAFDETVNKAVLDFSEATSIGDAQSQHFGIGTTFTFPDIERNGYILSGYKKNDSEQVISLDTPIVISEGITSYKPFWIGEDRVITWIINGTETTSTLKVGQNLSYTDTEPNRSSTAEHHFTFKGWNETEDTTLTSGEVTDLSSILIEADSTDSTYNFYAVFSTAIRRYDITFEIFDGNETTTHVYSLPYGQIPVYPESTPVRNSTDDYVFEFLGWNVYDPTIEEDEEETIIEIPTVSEEATYFAIFSKKPNRDIISEINGVEIYTKNGIGTYYVDFGEFPKSYVGSKLNSKLEELYNSGDLQQGLTETGKTWSANSSTAMGTYTEKQNLEYDYKGKRYVRASSLRYANGISYNFSDGTAMDVSGTVYWFKVEPIKWIILNWNNLSEEINPEGSGTETEIDLISADIIMAGIPFYHSTDSNVSVVWQNSITRAWLNGLNTTRDFTDKGFVNEAFNAEERNMIPDTFLVNSSDSGAGNNSAEGVEGFETTDKVYFLTYYDMTNKQSSYNTFFTGNSERRRMATDYAKAHNCFIHSLEDAYIGYSQYWIRSANTTIYVYTIGHIGNAVGNYSNRVNQGIVPSLRLNIIDQE